LLRVRAVERLFNCFVYPGEAKIMINKFKNKDFWVTAFCYFVFVVGIIWSFALSAACLYFSFFQNERLHQPITEMTSSKKYSILAGDERKAFLDAYEISSWTYHEVRHRARLDYYYCSAQNEKGESFIVQVPQPWTADEISEKPVHMEGSVFPLPKKLAKTLRANYFPGWTDAEFRETYGYELLILNYEPEDYTFTLAFFSVVCFVAGAALTYYTIRIFPKERAKEISQKKS